jgi:PAS domain S-box-containing protein
MDLLEFVPYPSVILGSDGTVNYLNDAFTELFGWTLDEMAGRHIPYIPPDLVEEAGQVIISPVRGKAVRRLETRRLTKDGRVLDVAVRIVTLSAGTEDDAAQLVILRDLSRERRSARNKELLLRISTALPAYPELEKLLDYISDEIRGVMNTEVALVILLDREKNEFSYVGVAHDTADTEKRIKEFRFPADRSIAGKVVRTGEPIIVSDISRDPDFYPGVDQKIGFVTRNLLEVPLWGRDQIIGVLCARNKREGQFDRTDVELLTMIAGTVALFIENAKVSEKLQQAYREVTDLNHAKEKAINHLSHELKTPVSVLKASINFLEKKMKTLPADDWKPGFDRVTRNLNRIVDIQHQVEDIVQARPHRNQELLTMLLTDCSDLLEAFVADETGDASAADRIRNRIHELYGGKEEKISEIDPARCVRERIQALEPRFAHREVEISADLEAHTPGILIPADVLKKIVDGLLRNAVENTPDGGRVAISVRSKKNRVELAIQDYGVGITTKNQKRIFEGFLVARDTAAYSSLRPFDFNAGGKGADLLRMTIFAERYNFKISMTSSRCKFIPEESDNCPGKISRCPFCADKEDCFHSGGSVFTLLFPQRNF